jgi:O-antigen/teichoic acid export membrane protein
MIRANQGREDKSAQSEGYDDYVGKIARGAGMSSFGQGIGRFMGYLTQLAIGQFYGVAQFSFYAIGLTLVQFANLLSQFGLDGGVVRYVAQYGAEGDTARVRGAILQSLGVSFGLSLLLSGAMFFGSGALADLVDKPFLETVFRAFSVGLPFFTLMSMALWATQGFQTVKYATYVQQVVRPLAQLVLIVAFYLLGVEILGAVAAYGISMALGSGLALYYLWRIFPKLLDRATPARFESRALFDVSGPTAVSTLTANLNAFIPIWVLTAFAPLPSVGLFRAAFSTAALSLLVMIAFNGIFSPIISSLHRQGLREDLGRLYKDVSRWTFTGALGVFLFTALLAPDVMALFGPKFVPGWPVLVILGAGQLFSASVGPAGRMLAMTGHQRVVMAASLVAVTSALILNVVLVPRLDIVGAAIGTAGGVVLINLITLLGVRRRLRYEPYDRAYLKPLAAGLAAALGLLALDLVLPLPNGLATLAVLGPVFVLTFVAALLLLGLSPSDRRFLTAFWDAVRRTVRRRPGKRG